MRARTILLLTALLAIAPATTKAQVKISGLAYLDYAYTMASPDATAEGDNGFDYRRVYLTADYGMSDRFSFRVRFEAEDGKLNSAGLPSPFVKDIYLRWKNVFGKGHEMFIGVSPVPSFGVAENFFDYRSLEKTTQDLYKVATSRDMGVSLRGPLTSSGSVKYMVMVGNNNHIRQETDRNKRVYGRLEFAPIERLTATVGADYAPYAGGSVTNLNAFAGYRLDQVRFGAEGFYNTSSFDADATADGLREAISVFVAAKVNDQSEVLVRVDRARNDVGGANALSTFGIVGLAWSPEPGIRFIPNLVLHKIDGADNSLVTGRITLVASF